ncbi:hypothetical protein [Streptomyces sp. RPT161]|uniref:hypothetical protein n=1 Tax=Streptomyces sp. RPT161 TaxID=3015993 RepID=UPI0022B88AC5|nr:hypothetical protein [Streptomyces sp. RPT161]
MRQAYAVYALLEALVDAPLDDPRIARAAQAVAECVPGEVVAALSLPSATDTHGSAVTEMLFADLAPAQSAAIQQAADPRAAVAAMAPRMRRRLPGGHPQP